MSDPRKRSPVRVLILDGSSKGRTNLRLALSGDPAIEVVDVRADSTAAIAACAASAPDVIAIGHKPASTEALLAIRQIMNQCPLPIVVVSPEASPERGTLAFDLLGAGAVAVALEPWSLDEPGRSRALAQLLQTVKLMAEVKVVRRWQRPEREAVTARRAVRRVELVAIGASTGGPVALKSIMSRLPKHFPVPIVVVQHMSTGFIDGLASWLSVDSAIQVRTAKAGDVLRPGCAYLAPDGTHMRLAANGALGLDLSAPLNGHRPAVSCLFRSAAEQYAASAIGILLSGMGKDGAAELKLMRDAGAITIAQDRASSVVYGMPGEAVRCQAAAHVMSPDEIAAALPAMVWK